MSGPTSLVKGLLKGKKKKPAKQIPLPTNKEELESVLMMVLVPDTRTVKRATEILSAFLKKPMCVPALIEQITQSEQRAARKVGAVLLRRRIQDHWDKLNADQKAFVCAALLGRVMQENDQGTLIALGTLIVAVAQVETKKGKWPELFPALGQLATSQEPAHVEVTMVIMRGLLERYNVSLNDARQHFRQYFESHVGSSNTSIRNRALQGLNALYVLYVEDAADRKSIETVPTVMINLLGSYLQVHHQDDDTQHIGLVLEIIELLLSSGLIETDEMIMSMLQVLMGCTTNSNVRPICRERAMQTVVMLMTGKPGFFTKNNLVFPYLDVLVNLLCEEAEDGFDSRETTAQRIAIEAMDTAFKYLPRSLIFDPVLNKGIGLIQDQSDPRKRKAGYLLLMALTEAAPTDVAEHREGDTFKQLLTFASTTMSNDHIATRLGAAVFIASVTIACPEDVAEHHEIVAPAVITALQSEMSVELRKKTIMVLEALCENIGPLVTPYINAMMDLMHKALLSTEEDIRETAVEVIRGIARAAGQGFLPYFSPVMTALTPYLQDPPEGEAYEVHPLLMRVRTTECLGAVLSAVGPSNWPENVVDITNQVLRGLVRVRDFELRESSFFYLGEVLCAMKDSAPKEYVHSSIYLGLSSIKSDDGITYESDEDDDIKLDESDEEDEEEIAKAQAARAGHAGAIEAEEAEEDEDEFFDPRKLRISNLAIEEKRSAIRMLTKLMRALGKEFMTYYQEVLSEIIEISTYHSDLLRHTILQFFMESLAFFRDHYPNPSGVIQGQATELHPEAKPFIDPIVQCMVESLRDDDDIDCVATAIQGLEHAITYFGMAIIPGPPSAEERSEYEEHKNDPGYDGGEPVDYQEMLFTSLTLLIKGQGLAQVVDEHDDVSASHGEPILDALCDFFGAFSRSCRENAVQYITSIMNDIKSYIDPRRPKEFRAFSVGAVGEIVEYARAEGQDSPFLSTLAVEPWLKEGNIPYAIACLQDPDTETRRCGAYVAGAIAMTSLSDNAKQGIRPFVQAAIPYLTQSLTESMENKSQSVSVEGAKDNYTSALGKFIKYQPESVDASQIIPLFLSALPFKSDMQEMLHAYPIALELLSNEAINTAYLGPVVASFIKGVNDEGPTSESGIAMMKFVKLLTSTFPSQMQNLVSVMDTASQETFNNIMKTE